MFPSLTTYETRDLFTPHPTRSDAWCHQGRIDDVIVFSNGEKTNPITFEQEISKHPEVRSALVAGHQQFEASLLIELLDTKPLSAHGNAEFIDRVWPTVQKANAECPSHARVSKAKILLVDPVMPMMRTSKGTIQRQATWNLYAEKLTTLYSEDDLKVLELGSLAVDIDVQNLEAVSRTVRRSVELVTSWSDLDDQDDFFARGMNSLQVLQLGRALSTQLRIGAVTAKEIYTNASVSRLAKRIPKLNDETLPTALSTSVNSRQSAMSILLQKYKTKIEMLKPTNHHNTGNGTIHGGSATSMIVLLTGSTGAIASHILHELLQRDEVGHVYCLNRAVDSNVLQVERNRLRGLPVNFDPSRVTFVTSNYGRPDLDIVDKPLRTEIMANVNCIIHTAWPVDFNLSLAAFVPSLDGLCHLLSFAMDFHHKPAFLFLSSISSMSNYHQIQNAAGQIPEAIVMDFACPGEMGYAESKYLGERILDYASAHLHMKVASIRVGQVAGTSNDPNGWSPKEWFPSLVLSSSYLKALPASLGTASKSKPDGPLGSIDWIPIDMTAKIIFELSCSLTISHESSSAVFNLVNSRRVPWTKLIPTVVETLADCKQEVSVVPYGEWFSRLADKAISQDTAEDFNTAIVRNPGIRLLDFYRDVLDAEADSVFTTDFAIKRTLSTSETLRKLEAIKPEWISGWVEDWIRRL